MLEILNRLKMGINDLCHILLTIILIIIFLICSKINNNNNNNNNNNHSYMYKSLQVYYSKLYHARVNLIRVTLFIKNIWIIKLGFTKTYTIFPY